MLSLQEWGICEENTHLQSNGADRYWVFAPTAQKGYFTEIMEHVGYSGLEKSGGGKGTVHRTEAHIPPSLSTPPLEFLAVPSVSARHMLS